MPNGGIDNCGTCWYNDANIVARGEAPNRSEGAFHFCTIRQFQPADPFWTYCLNHGYAQPDGAPIPVGPAYGIKEDGDHLYERTPITSHPDSEPIRQQLLRVLTGQDPMPVPFEVLLEHLEALEEKRAIPMLESLLEDEDHSGDWRQRVEEAVRVLRDAMGNG